MIQSALSLASRLAFGCCLSLGAAVVVHAKSFQQYLNGNCPDKICTISFQKVPKGKTLTVSNVSCYLRIDSTPISIRCSCWWRGGTGPLPQR